MNAGHRQSLTRIKDIKVASVDDIKIQDQVMSHTTGPYLPKINQSCQPHGKLKTEMEETKFSWIHTQCAKYTPKYEA